MQNTFLANLFRMKHINRWSLMHNTQQENLSEHSFECALVVHFLAMIGNVYCGKNYDADKLATFALFHDASETLTGDLPTPIKYFNKDIYAAFDEIETLAAAKIVAYLPEELKDAYAPYFAKTSLKPEEKALLGAADKLCAYIKCISEITAGNREFSIAYKTINAQIYTNPLAEVSFFLENCTEAFSLSLDELQGGAEDPFYGDQV